MITRVARSYCINDIITSHHIIKRALFRTIKSTVITIFIVLTTFLRTYANIYVNRYIYWINWVTSWIYKFSFQLTFKRGIIVMLSNSRKTAIYICLYVDPTRRRISDPSKGVLKQLIESVPTIWNEIECTTNYFLQLLVVKTIDFNYGPPINAKTIYIPTVLFYYYSI